jgi:hypothetical protein
MWTYIWFKGEASVVVVDFDGLLDMINHQPLAIQVSHSAQMPLVERDRRSNTTLIYHIGWASNFGQTNNQVHSILRALDELFDETGEWCGHGINAPAVVAVSGWARATLRMFFVPQAQTKPYAGSNVTNLESEGNWTGRLEQHLPIVTYNRVKLAPPPDTEIVVLASDQAYYYTRRLQDSVDPVRLEHRRIQILQILLRLVPETRFD